MDEQSTDLNQENVTVPTENINNIEGGDTQQINTPISFEPIQQPVPLVNPVIQPVNIVQPVAVVQPAPNYIPETQQQPAVVHTNPIEIVLQWLTYAFWGWTAIAILVISTMVLSFYIQNSDIASMLPYSIAAVAVLLPISITCELLYKKREPVKKTGASSVIMIIHAVIFALCGAGALITIVLNIVRLLIGVDSGDSLSAQVAIYTSVVMVIIYAVLLFRTIIPEKLFKLRMFIILFMTLVCVVLTAASVMGPIVTEMLTKNDKLIENNLSNVADIIDAYSVKNAGLPNALTDLPLTGDAKRLVTENLITYVKEGRSTESSQFIYYRYQLCANYTKASSNNGYSDPYYDSFNDNDGYSAYARTSRHAAGKVCYKMQINSYLTD